MCPELFFKLLIMGCYYVFMSIQACLPELYDASVRTVVTSVANQIVQTGPGNEYTQILGDSYLGQLFVASKKVDDWYEIDFPSENGPATGWIQATPAIGDIWEIDDPIRGLIGVSVCPTPDACASSPARLSYVWDAQQIVELDQALPQNGCASPWIKTSVLDVGEGWVCGDYLKKAVTLATPQPLNDTGIEQNRYRGSFPSVILTPEYYLHFPDLSSSNFLMLDIP